MDLNNYFDTRQPRRDMLQQLGMFAAGGVALSACSSSIGNVTGITKPSPAQPHTGDANSIEHVVIACQENRSFDVVAGSTHNQRTGDIKPAVVCIDAETTVIAHTGEPVSATTIQQLQEGSVMVVEGKENKRGGIQATHVVL